jgi:hypothetical protein
MTQARQHVFTAGRKLTSGGRMQSKEKNAILGKIAFALTAAAMLTFFWWLLIYDHGVVSVH